MGATQSFKHIVLLLLVLIVFSSFGFSYEIIQEQYHIRENGNVDVTLTINDYDPENLDFRNEINSDVVTVESDENNNRTLLQYTTSYLTRKERGIWYFTSHNMTSERIDIFFPPHVQIVRSHPPASIQGGQQLRFYWTNISSSVVVSFVFTNAQSSAVTQPQQEMSSSNNNILFLVIVFSGAFLILALGSVIIMKRAQTFIATSSEKHMKTTSSEQLQKRPDISEGQMNIIRTANPNGSTIITLLLRHNNHMKRTDLEKESGLAKSSLASTLNSLEKKGIVKVDRSFHIHHIKLSEWFQTL